MIKMIAWENLSVDGNWRNNVLPYADQDILDSQTTYGPWKNYVSVETKI